MTRADLIAALENADGASESLNSEIQVITFPENPFPYYCPRYTSSIDAALTLVPDGMEWSVTTLYGEATAEVGLNNTTGMHSTGRRKDGSVAIALCIAALKAGGD